MATWESKPTAYLILWITMKDFNQLTTNYVDSGTLKMSDLTFYNSLATPEQRAIAAKMLAVQLDQTFIKTYRSTYENGVNTSQATGDIEAILTSANDTMLDLGVKVDALYKFITES